MGSIDDKLSVRILDRIKLTDGDVLKGISFDDPEFTGFGELYFSWIKAGRVKGWKQHTSMVSNLIVPIGEVRFSFVDPISLERRDIVSGDNSYKVITVQPGLWMAFGSCSAADSLIANLASIRHDPSEEIRNNIDFFPWSIE